MSSFFLHLFLLMPNEDTIYLADSKNAPYGVKSKEEIIALSKKNTELLLENNCKIIVVACNTATTNAIKELRASFDVPFIGIEPAIKPAATHSKTQTIGILATKGTLSSELFNKTVSLYQETNIIEQIGYGLVELIENGEINSPQMEKLLISYLKPMIEKNIDYLVLGCSHYPYLIPKIKTILPKSIQIIDSGEAVAKQTLAVLQRQNSLNNIQKGNCLFYSNIDPKVLNDILENKYNVSKRDF